MPLKVDKPTNPAPQKVANPKGPAKEQNLAHGTGKYDNASLAELVGKMLEVLTQNQLTPPTQLGPNQGLPPSLGPGRPWLPRPQRPNYKAYFNRGAEGHFARECPHRMQWSPRTDHTITPGAGTAHPNEMRLPQLAPGQSQQ